MPAPVLRDYQFDLVTLIRMAMVVNRRVLAVASTGAGKTYVFAYITANAVLKRKRVYIIAHRKEIVNQISIALASFGVRHGRIQPGHTMTNDLVQVAMVQTLARRLDKLPEPDLLVVDEAHHAIAGSYKMLTDRWQRMRVLGVTATPQRGDGKGLGEAFDVLVEAIPMRELIELRALSTYQYLAPPQKADLTGISNRMGDFAIDELAEAMDKSVITGDAVSHYTTHLAGRPAIAFCVSIKHAEHVAAQFAAAGYRAASVDGTMEDSVRSARIRGIGDGRLNVLTSCDLISEGTDIPVVSGAILLRPTKSLGLHLQQIGRVLRPKPDGSHAIILDHVGNVHRHGLPDAPREWTLDTKPKKPPAPATKTCEACFQVFAVGPGWMQEPCENEPDCVFAQKKLDERKPLEVVDGTLEIVTEEDAIRRKKLRELLRGNETLHELQVIGRIRGYKVKWARYVFDAQQQRRMRT